jgi:hypothetical protein
MIVMESGYTATINNPIAIFFARKDLCITGIIQLLPTSNIGIYSGDNNRLVNSSKREILAMIIIKKAYTTKKQVTIF